MSIVFNGTTIKKLFFNGTEIKKANFGTTNVFVSEQEYTETITMNLADYDNKRTWQSTSSTKQGWRYLVTLQNAPITIKSITVSRVTSTITILKKYSASGNECLLFQSPTVSVLDPSIDTYLAINGNTINPYITFSVSSTRYVSTVTTGVSDGTIKLTVTYIA